MIRDVDRAPLIIRHYPGYPHKNERRWYGPYTVEDHGDSKLIWRHGWRAADDRVDEVRNVCRRLPNPARLPL